jgi:hypothetical protein
MTSRKEEREKSLAALRRIAEESKAQPWLAKPKAKPAPSRSVRMPPAPPATRPRPPAPGPRPAAPAPAARTQRARAEKLAEERALKARRANELLHGATASWRGMPHAGVGRGIARTPFDRAEPKLAEKIDDVLGAAKEKEGRAKARAKGRRQRGA